MLPILLDASEYLWNALDNKKPAKPYAMRVFGLHWSLLDRYLVELGGFEPPSKITTSLALHA